MAFSGGSTGGASFTRSQSPFSKLNNKQLSRKLTFFLAFFPSNPRLELATAASDIRNYKVFEMSPPRSPKIVGRDNQAFGHSDESALVNTEWDQETSASGRPPVSPPTATRRRAVKECPRSRSRSPSSPSSPALPIGSSDLFFYDLGPATSFSHTNPTPCPSSPALSCSSFSSATSSCSSVFTATTTATTATTDIIDLFCGSFSSLSVASTEATANAPRSFLAVGGFAGWRDRSSDVVEIEEWSPFNFPDDDSLGEEIVPEESKVIGWGFEEAMQRLTLDEPDTEMAQPPPSSSPAANPFSAATLAAPANPFSSLSAGANGSQPATTSNPFGGFGQASSNTQTMPSAAPANSFAALAQPSKSLFPPAASAASTSQPPPAANPFAATPPSTAGSGSNHLGMMMEHQSQSVPAQVTVDEPSMPQSQVIPSTTGFAAGHAALPGTNGLVSTNPFSAQMNGTRNAFVEEVDVARKRKNVFAYRGDSTVKKSMVQQASQPQASRNPFPSSSQPLSLVSSDLESSEYAKNIYDHLRKDGIEPFTCPEHLGNPSNRNEAEKFREKFKEHRERVRASLIRGNLIDDPDVKKKLSEAIVFKGICEEMCPEFEKITRIVQHDVKMPEKEADSDGTLYAAMPSMVKALARSAAGQEAPLPMDVRSTAALRRTFDYLIDIRLGDDSKLPAMHGFLWDRTRAIRRDFVFHSTMSAADMGNVVYCLENIARFHIIALHLLSRKDFAPDDFSEAQEKEQFGRTLLSLMEAYDDCQEKGIRCENEAEFRAYFLLHHVGDPNVEHKAQGWDRGLWETSDELHLATSLSQAMKTVREWSGPLRPGEPLAAAADGFVTFFRIIETPAVSYTMACLAETHFLKLRRNILNNIVRAYSRNRDSPTDVTVTAVHELLKFDTRDETIEFVTQHGLDWSGERQSEPYLLIDKNTEVVSQTVRQSFSHRMVERKRGRHSLPEVIHHTITQAQETDVTDATLERPDLEEESMFIPQDDNFQGSSNASSTTMQDLPSSSTAFPLTSTPVTKPGLKNETRSQPLQPIQAPSAFAMPGQKAHEAPKQAALEIVDSQHENSISKSRTSATHTASTNFLFPSKPTSATGRFTPPSASTISSNNADQAPTAVLKPAQPPHQNASSGGNFLQAVAAQSNGGPTALSAPTSMPFKSNSDKPSDVMASRSPLSSEHTEQSVPSTARNDHTAPIQHIQAVKIPTTAPVASLKAPRQSDLMGGFAKWFVVGDGGMMEDFEAAYVTQLVKEAFEEHRNQERERRRQEEDANSWAQARQWRHHHLGMKYLQIWRANARERRMQQRAREVRESQRAYIEAQIAKRRADRAEDAKKRSSAGSSFTEELRASVSSLAKAQSKPYSTAEETLLQTGILRGVHNEADSAARVVRGRTSTPDTMSTVSAPVGERQLSRHGLNNDKFRSSCRLLRPSQSGKLRQQFKRASSISPPASVSKAQSPSLAGSSSFRHSFSARPTNFSRTYKNTSQYDNPEQRSAFSKHWTLRSMGFRHTEDGNYVHESLLNNGSSHNSVIGQGSWSGDVLRTSQARSSVTRYLQSSFSTNEQPCSPPQGGKRKRTQEEEASQDTSRLDAHSPSDAKKRKSWGPEEAEQVLRDLQETRHAIDEGTDWFREQNERMLKGSPILDDEES